MTPTPRRPTTARPRRSPATVSARESSTISGHASARRCSSSTSCPNDDLFVRVTTDAWAQTGAALKTAGFTWFSFLSAIDWMPSPYGKGEEDPTVEKEPIDMTIKQGVCGGETRMQVFARLTDLDRHVGITIKADVPDGR